jgi:hypothetical protein
LLNKRPELFKPIKMDYQNDNYGGYNNNYNTNNNTNNNYSGNYGGNSYGNNYGNNSTPYNRQFFNRRNSPNSYRRSPYNTEGNMSSYYDEYNNSTPQYYEDRIYDDEAQEYERPTYRRSKTIANPDFGNFHFKKGYTAEVWLNDGETVVLSADSRKKTYRTHYSPEYMRRCVLF